MSKLNTLPINTPVGIINSRTAFWLKSQSYNPDKKQLIIEADFSSTELSENGKQFKISMPFKLTFNGVLSFDCKDYDSFEDIYGEISKSNFEQILDNQSSTIDEQIYLVWFYDNGFSIRAKGYNVSGFEKA